METGWLSPEGKMYPCNKYDHIFYSEKLIAEYHYKKTEDSADEILLKHNWVHISFLTFFDYGFHLIWFNRLTEEQKRYLKPFFEDPNEIIAEDSKRSWALEQ